MPVYNTYLLYYKNNKYISHNLKTHRTQNTDENHQIITKLFIILLVGNFIARYICYSSK